MCSIVHSCVGARGHFSALSGGGALEAVGWRAGGWRARRGERRSARARNGGPNAAPARRGGRGQRTSTDDGTASAAPSGESTDESARREARRRDETARSERRETSNGGRARPRKRGRRAFFGLLSFLRPIAQLPRKRDTYSCHSFDGGRADGKRKETEKCVSLRWSCSSSAAGFGCGVAASRFSRVAVDGVGTEWVSRWCVAGRRVAVVVLLSR